MSKEHISKRVADKLHHLGINTEFDLLLNFPLRYEDHTTVWKYSELKVGHAALLEGNVSSVEILSKPRRSLVVQLSCNPGTFYLRYLHFYANYLKQFEIGARVRVFGPVRSGYYGLEMIQPKYWRVLSEEKKTTLTPIYSTSGDIRSNTIAKLVQDVLSKRNITEVLSGQTLARIGLPSIHESLITLHSPPASASILALEERSHPAWRRIKFDELLAQQLSLREHHRRRSEKKSPTLLKLNLSCSFEKSLPFALTLSQKSAIKGIRQELASTIPMQKLLQGDVGSGKTIVAVLAAIQAIENGYQVAFMSPTEILAEQHFQVIETWLRPLNISSAWLVGSQTKQERKKALIALTQGTAQIAVGTHTLIQQQVEFRRLGLIIIDEQHKFGVLQRLALQEKGEVPHQLMMSATPIPRSLAMSYLATLDITSIDELPPGRKPIVTKLICDLRRDEVVARIRDACRSGQQAYWVCPLIEESSVLELQTAEETYTKLKDTMPDISVGLIHGKMKKAEKQLAMEQFCQGQTKLLVATTVIEVGVDVPNASLIVIENAERMGLSQLHQLRGRVGRGKVSSTCILLYQQPLSELAKSRLRVIFETMDGFEIARQDMLLRGPGEVLGASQSGMPMLRFADIEQDQELLIAARQEAEEMLDQRPDAAKIHLERWLGEKRSYLLA